MRIHPEENLGYLILTPSTYEALVRLYLAIGKQDEEQINRRSYMDHCNSWVRTWCVVEENAGIKIRILHFGTALSREDVINAIQSEKILYRDRPLFVYAEHLVNQDFMSDWKILRSILYRN